MHGKCLKMFKSIKIFIVFSLVIFLSCSFSFATEDKSEKKIDSNIDNKNFAIENNTQKQINSNSNSKQIVDVDSNQIISAKKKVATPPSNVSTASQSNLSTVSQNNVSTPSQSNVSTVSKKLSVEENSPVKLSQSSILSAANSVKSYVNKNGKLPYYVTIDNYDFSMPELLYLMAKTVNYKYLKSSALVTVKYEIKNPTNPTGNSINTKISKKNYYKIANNVINYINKYNTAPNFASLSSSKIQYQTLIFGFSSILSYNFYNKKLPNSLSLNVKSGNSLNKNNPIYTRIVKSFDINDSNSDKNVDTKSVLAASTTVKNYIESQNKLPNFITIDNKNYTMPCFMYIISNLISSHGLTALNAKTPVIENISKPDSPSGNSINAKISPADYYDISNRISVYITKYNKAPNFVNSKYGKIQYQTAIYGLVKILDYYNKNKVFPTSLTLNIKNTHKINK